MLLVIALLQSVLTGAALPFYPAVSLWDALVAGWTCAPARLKYAWFELLVVLAAAAALFLYARGRSRTTRWIAVAGALAVAPFYLPLDRWIWSNFFPELIRWTQEPFTEDTDGEAWELYPMVVMCWWLLLWIAVAVLEIILPGPAPEHAPGGFEVTISPATPAGRTPASAGVGSGRSCR